MTKTDAFKYFHSSPEITRSAVMLYVRFPSSLRNVEDLLHEHGVYRRVVVGPSITGPSGRLVHGYET